MNYGVERERLAKNLKEQITDKEMGIVILLLNYKKPKIEATHRDKDGNNYFNDKGWMFAQQICEDSEIDLPHRSTYLKMLKKRGLIERARVIVKDERGRASKQGLYVYRLKPEKAYLIFCLLYLKERIWEALDSDYLNDTALKWDRWLLASMESEDRFYDKREREVQQLRRENKPIPVPFSLGEEKTYKEIEKEMKERKLMVSPTGVYLNYTGKKFPKIVRGIESDFAFLVYDYAICPYPHFKQRIYNTIKRLRPVVKHAIENRGWEEKNGR